MLNPDLLQKLRDRLAGLPVNGTHAGQFQEPLASLWRELDARPGEPTQQIFQDWAGSDPDRIDLASEILKLTPGGSPPPDPWQIQSLADAYKPRPPLEYLVEDTLVVPSLVIVYGAPGSLKSMLLADMFLCMAAGIDWLPAQVPTQSTEKQTMQAPVLWCDFDNGKRRTSERFEALGRKRNVPADVPLYYVSMPNPWLDAGDMKSIEDLMNRIVRLGVRAVAMDNLGTIKGKAEENSAEMIQVMSNLRQIVEMCNVSLTLLHHQRKSMGLQKTRAGDSLRGHTSIEAALDLALLVNREPQSDNIEVKSTKTRDVDVPVFGAFFEYSHKQGTRELETAGFCGVQVDDTTSQQAVKNAIITVVMAQHPIIQKDLVAAVKAVLPDVGINRIQATANNLVTSNQLFSRPGQHKATVYDIIP